MPPPKVRLRIYRAQDGRCKSCTRKLSPGNITADHIKPLEDGGQNRESNMQLICTAPCSSDKTGQENSRRANADRALAKHLGFKPKFTRPLPGSRKSRYKRKVDGTVVLRDE